MFSSFSYIVGCTVKQGSVKCVSPLAFIYSYDMKLHWLFETSTYFDVHPHVNLLTGKLATNSTADTKRKKTKSRNRSNN